MTPELERAARARYEAQRDRMALQGSHYVSWEGLSEQARRCQTRDMRAALEAFREPSDEMITAMERAATDAAMRFVVPPIGTGENMHRVMVRAAWTAAIDYLRGER